MTAIPDEGLTPEVARTMNDESLSASQATLSVEIAPRANLAAIPEQIWELEHLFLAEGGDPAALVRPDAEVSAE